ncbi:MAG: hypothetical protein ACTS6H_00680 [Candidatus Hodgkinia cicadicola]
MKFVRTLIPAVLSSISSPFQINNGANWSLFHHFFRSTCHVGFSNFKSSSLNNLTY